MKPSKQLLLPLRFFGPLHDLLLLLCVSVSSLPLHRSASALSSMAVTFPNLSSPWLWRKASDEPAPASPSTTALRDADNLPYAAAHNQTSFQKPRATSSKSHSLQASRRAGERRRWQSRGDKHRLDPEFDIILVPSDGGCCISASDSDDSDWSVGWFEPHAPEFSSDDESENSFAVLVPCYGSPSPDVVAGKETFSLQDASTTSQLWAAVLSNLSNGSKSDGKQYLEQWLSSVQE